jgi:hypothetical protein
MPSMVPFLTGALVLVVGVIALSGSIVSIARARTPAAITAVVICLAIGIASIFAPTRHLAQLIRFHFKEAGFRRAIDERKEGRQPWCVISQECLVDFKEPNYIVFPYPGLLTGWVGIVHASSGFIDPDFSSRQAFSRDTVCEVTPVEEGFFLCGFD